MVNNPAARKKFVRHAINFIEQNNFDGLDLDWEYPRYKYGQMKPPFDLFVKQSKYFSSWLGTRGEFLKFATGQEFVYK